MDNGYEITIPREDEAEHIGNMLLQFNLEIVISYPFSIFLTPHEASQ